MTKQELKNLIDLEITNKTANKSITPLNVGGNLKRVLDYYENTDVLPEGIVNLYFTAQRVLDIVNPLLGTGQDVSGKENKSEKGQVNGYAPLDSNSKVPSANLNIVNDLITGGTTNILSAEQGKLLKTQIDNLNLLLASDNINLNTIQKIVDAIESLQTTLGVEIINDLTSGGATKALSAEMGKQLNLLKQSTSNLSQSIIADQLNNSKYPSTKEVYDFINTKISEINGGGSVSNLQTVTNIGNSTTNNVIVKDVLVGSVINQDFETKPGIRIDKNEAEGLSTLIITDEGYFQKLENSNLTKQTNIFEDTLRLYSSDTINNETKNLDINSESILYNTSDSNGIKSLLLNLPKPIFILPTTRTLPLSVNNQIADEFGNITISTGNSGSSDLQTITDIGNITTNNIQVKTVVVGEVIDKDSLLNKGIKAQSNEAGSPSEGTAIYTNIITSKENYLEKSNDLLKQKVNIFDGQVSVSYEDLVTNETEKTNIRPGSIFYETIESGITKNIDLFLPKPGVSNINKTIPLSVNNTFADEFGNITINVGGGSGVTDTLQTVTNNGNATTNNISVKYIFIGETENDNEELKSTILLQDQFSPTITKITDIDFSQKIDNSTYKKEISMKEATEISVIYEDKTLPVSFVQYIHQSSNSKIIGRNIDGQTYNIIVNHPVNPLQQNLVVVEPLSVNGIYADIFGNIILPNFQKIITSNYILISEDNNYSIIINNGNTPITITVPTGLTSNFQVGFIQQGTGDVSFITSGTTLNTPLGLKIKGANYNAYIEKIGTTEVFQLLGNLKV